MSEVGIFRAFKPNPLPSWHKDRTNIATRRGNTRTRRPSSPRVSAYSPRAKVASKKAARPASAPSRRPGTAGAGGPANVDGYVDRLVSRTGPSGNANPTPTPPGKPRPTSSYGPRTSRDEGSIEAKKSVGRPSWSAGGSRRTDPIALRGQSGRRAQSPSQGMPRPSLDDEFIVQDDADSESSDIEKHLAAAAGTPIARRPTVDEEEMHNLSLELLQGTGTPPMPVAEAITDPTHGKPDKSASVSGVDRPPNLNIAILQPRARDPDSPRTPGNDQPLRPRSAVSQRPGTVTSPRSPSAASPVADSPAGDVSERPKSPHTVADAVTTSSQIISLSSVEPRPESPKSPKSPYYSPDKSTPPSTFRTTRPQSAGRTRPTSAGRPSSAVKRQAGGRPATTKAATGRSGGGVGGGGLFGLSLAGSSLAVPGPRTATVARKPVRTQPSTSRLRGARSAIGAHAALSTPTDRSNVSQLARSRTGASSSSATTARDPKQVQNALEKRFAATKRTPRGRPTTTTSVPAKTATEKPTAASASSSSWAITHTDTATSVAPRPLSPWRDDDASSQQSSPVTADPLSSARGSTKKLSTSSKTGSKKKLTRTPRSKSVSAIGKRKGKGKGTARRSVSKTGTSTTKRATSATPKKGKLKKEKSGKKLKTPSSARKKGKTGKTRSASKVKKNVETSTAPSDPVMPTPTPPALPGAPAASTMVAGTAGTSIVVPEAQRPHTAAMNTVVANPSPTVTFASPPQVTAPERSMSPSLNPGTPGSMPTTPTAVVEMTPTQRLLSQTDQIDSSASRAPLLTVQDALTSAQARGVVNLQGEAKSWGIGGTGDANQRPVSPYSDRSSPHSHVSLSGWDNDLDATGDSATFAIAMDRPQVSPTGEPVRKRGKSALSARKKKVGKKKKGSLGKGKGKKKK